jgi:signal transduction histidine kinase
MIRDSAASTFMNPRSLQRAALETLDGIVTGVVDDDPQAKIRVVMILAGTALPFAAVAAFVLHQRGWQLVVAGKLISCAVILWWLRRRRELGSRAAVFLLGVVPSLFYIQATIVRQIPIEARIAWAVLIPAVAAVLWGPRVAIVCAALGLATLSAVSFWTQDFDAAALNAAAFVLGLLPIILFVNTTAVKLRTTVSQLRRTQADRDRLQHAFDEASERERAKIAAELHDDTIQVMTAATMKLDLIRTRQQPGGGKTQDLGDALKLMQEAISRARRLSFDLYPPALDDGLRPALLEAAEHIGRGCFAVAVDVGDDRFSAESERLTFRTAKELLENARKHSQAQVVEVRVEVRANVVELVVADDGVGFDRERSTSAADGQFHFGLRAAEERVRRAGGTLTVESNIGRGTTVSMLLPVGNTDRSGHWPRALY